MLNLNLNRKWAGRVFGPCCVWNGPAQGGIHAGREEKSKRKRKGGAQVGQAVHGHAGLHGPCSHGMVIRWPWAIVPPSPRRARLGGRARQRRSGRRPGNLPVSGESSMAEVGRCRGCVGSYRGGSAASAPPSWPPAVPPSSRRPADGSDVAALSGRPGEEGTGSGPCQRRGTE
jgi:hypothetical protein